MNSLPELICPTKYSLIWWNWFPPFNVICSVPGHIQSGILEFRRCLNTRNTLPLECMTMYTQGYSVAWRVLNRLNSSFAPSSTNSVVFIKHSKWGPKRLKRDFCCPHGSSRRFHRVEWRWLLGRMHTHLSEMPPLFSFCLHASDN